LSTQSLDHFVLQPCRIEATVARVVGVTVRTPTKMSADFLAEVRLEGERIAATTAGGLRILDVSAVDDEGTRAGRARVTFEMLNDALLPARQLVEVAGPRELAGLLRSVAAASTRRGLLRQRLASKDCIAIVDDLVEAALAHAGSTVGEVVAALRDGPGGVVTVAATGLPVVKAWMEDGRLICSFELSRELRWNSSRLVVRLPLFSIMQMSLARRSVSAIAKHPMLPKAIRIGPSHAIGGENEFTLRTTVRDVTRQELGNHASSIASKP